MAINELITRTLVKFQGDTTDLKAKIKDLANEEKKLAEIQLKGVEDHNKAIDGLIGKLSAAGLAYGALRLATDSLTAAKERSRLEDAAAGVSISRLADATKGLKRETELLSDAAKLNHGAIKLTTEQMAIAEQAMLQYTREGKDNAKVHETILQAVTALKLDGLKDLGVFVDTAGLSIEKASDRGKILDRVFGELTKASQRFAAQSLSDAEKLEVTANRVGNAIDRLKASVGRGLQAGVGYVEEVSNPRELSKLATFGVDVGDVGGVDAVERAKFLEQNVYGPLRIAQQRIADIETGRSITGALGADLFGAFSGPFAPGPTTKSGSTPAAKGTFDGKAYAEAFAASVRASMKIEANASAIGGLGFNRPELTLGSSAGSGVDIFGAGITQALQDIPEARRLTNEWLEDIATRTRHKSIAEQIVGDIPSTLQLASQAFGAFTDVMGDAWTKAITGAESFGTALKKGAGAALLGTSKELFGIGVKEEVLALASLALGPIGGASAAAHAAAGAAAFAGAALTGGLAVSLGAGGSGAAPRSAATNPGPGAAPGAGYTGAAPGREEGPRTVYHIIGDRFDTETNPRRRFNNAKRFQKMLDSNHYAADR